MAKKIKLNGLRILTAFVLFFVLIGTSGAGDAIPGQGEKNSEYLELEWKFKTGDDVKSSPAVTEDRIYAGSDDNYLYCLNKTTLCRI